MVVGLGLQTESSGGGDYAPLLKYDARAGRVFRCDRSEGPQGWLTDNVDVTQGLTFVPDLDNVEVGWAMFAAGVAPSFEMVPLGDRLPPKPSENHKQAFRMKLKLGKASGGDVREFASQAKVVIGAIDALHTQYEKEKAQYAGQLPIVALKGTTPIKSNGKGQTSTNYAPIFEITKWVPRPADLAGDDAGDAHEPAPVAQPASKASKAIAPPPPVDDDEDFG